MQQTTHTTSSSSLNVSKLPSFSRQGWRNMETAWIWAGKWPETKGEDGVVKPHTHDFDEILAYVGTDPKDPYNLNGEVEVWIDGNQNILNRSFVAFIPKGIEHGPLTIKRVDKPIFHFSVGMSKKYQP